MTIRQALLIGPFVCALFFGLLFGFFGTYPIRAIAQGGSTPFGGQIEGVTYCTCSLGILLEVGDPTPADVLFQFGQSTLYPYGMIFFTGPWVLGTYSSGGQCEVISGTSCTSEGNPDGTVDIIGTSLF